MCYHCDDNDSSVVIMVKVTVFMSIMRAMLMMLARVMVLVVTYDDDMCNGDDVDECVDVGNVDGRYEWTLIVAMPPVAASCWRMCR